MRSDKVIHALFPTRVLESATELASRSDPHEEPSPGGIGLTELVAGFDSEDKCRAYLERLRWPTGVRCPRCDASNRITRIETRGQFDCRSCGYQFSVRAGTILHASHVPVWKWFLAVYLMSRSGDMVSGHRLEEILGVSYKTAWFLRHRVRLAMRGAPSRSRSMAAEGSDLFRDILSRLIRADSTPPAELIATAS